MERDNPKKLSVLDHGIASLLITLFATSTLFGKIPWVALIWPDQQRPVERCWIKRNPVYNCTVILLREAELNIKEDHLCRWTTFSRKCPVRLKRWNVSIMFRPERSEILAYPGKHVWCYYSIETSLKMCLC